MQQKPEKTAPGEVEVNPGGRCFSLELHSHTDTLWTFLLPNLYWEKKTAE